MFAADITCKQSAQLVKQPSVPMETRGLSQLIKAHLLNLVRDSGAVVSERAGTMMPSCRGTSSGQADIPSSN